MDTMFADMIAGMIASIIEFIFNVAPGYWLILIVFLIAMLIGAKFRFFRDIINKTFDR